MNTQKNNSLGPFVVLTFIYFIVGFLTTVNGQFQGPLKIAFLSHTEELKNTLTTLISFFFFLGYLLNSSLGGRWINSHGYKSTLLRALAVMVGGLLTYSFSSWLVVHYGEAGINILADRIPYGYFVFLLGSYLMGTSAALLQVVINPYIAAYDLPGTQPVQRMNIVCAINSFGTTIAPFFVTGIMFAGVALESVTADQLLVPFLLIALCIILTTAVTSRLSLPDIQGTRADSGEKLSRSIWSFRHLKLGVIAIFFYVGAEVSVGVNVNLHAMELIEAGHGLSFFGKDHLILWGLDLGIPALLATLYWGGFMVGRLTFSFFNQVSSRVLLVVTTFIAIVLTFIAIFTNNLWVLVSVGLCHSVMWSCIFTLAIKGLGRYTSKASGVFMMGVFGGAIFPVLQGVLADIWDSWQWTWLIVIVCELVMLYYALSGSRIKDADKLQ
ncbi:MFS transporter [Parabacteroides acidifaciens]|uniref:MFS transporter n=1 Tax=Parabacteroides acidifaciens TaxID=2290935 RepID=A0A3D8HGW6_9BACT|nr:MFS transporter [Parabacteroides acidifaciens]MBC8601180.1 MFS transporter [Parabacteroides acidifaciens]RDU50239.1 MFS transporter [Parabacteroides acidifaciens]